MKQPCHGTFISRFFDKLQESPYVNVNELLLTGKRACYVLETVDPTYLSFSAHYNENIQKVASLADIDDEIFKFTTNFAEDQVAAGEAWVNENIDGVKAMTTGYKSIDIVLDHVDKGGCHCRAGQEARHRSFSSHGFLVIISMICT